MDNPSSLVMKTAVRLRMMSQEAAERDYLGAEGDLLTKLGVSRPTLRQAARLVHKDGFIEIRRGGKGGFYATRPAIRDVISNLAEYLRIQNTNIEDVRPLSDFASELAVELAARSVDDACRDELERLSKEPAPSDSDSTVASETQMMDALARRGGNPMIVLILAIGYTFGREYVQLPIFDNAVNRELIGELRRDICRAVLASDADLAKFLMRRRIKTLSEWIAAR